MTKTFADAIFGAEQISTRKEKLEALSGLGRDEQRLIVEALSPYRVFNVKKYDWPTSFNDGAVDATYDKFFTLLDSLHSRQLTGNEAREAITNTLSTYPERTAKALARVIEKNLDCGADRSSFLKVYPDLTIPTFELMLASKIEEKRDQLTGEILAKKYGLVFPMQAEAKYDGNRLIAMVTESEVKYYARSGKESKLGTFDTELLEIRKWLGHDFVIDGEVLASSFQETMNAKSDSNEKARDALKFYAFDLMSLAEWEANSCPRVQHVRTSQLTALLAAPRSTQRVVQSKVKTVHNMKELLAFLDEVIQDGINPDGTLNGLGEGLIIKDLNGYYEWERSEVVRDRKTKVVTKATYWTKFKPIITVDAKIVDFFEGRGRLVGTLGGVVVEGVDENGRQFRSDVGSGFKDKDRDMIWANRGKYLNATVELEVQEISLAQNATVHSLRFPIYKQLRDDK